MSSKVQMSNLLVVCHAEDDFKNLSQVLAHYFPNPDHPQALLISNKYYCAHVNLICKTWTEAFNSHPIKEGPSHSHSQQQQVSVTNHQQVHKNLTQSTGQKETPDKYDLMIMLVDESEQNIINFQNLDDIIEAFNPEEFVLLINTSQPENPWAHEETILQKCNNFIEIVKEDLFKINKARPTWNRGALLNHEEEDDESGIFSILDRMETTRWATMVNLNKSESSQKPQISIMTPIHSLETSNQNQLKNSEFTSKQQLASQSNENVSEKKPQNAQNNSSEDEEVDEKRLQEEMREFENMMGQMMSFKTQSAGMKDVERKQKAEQLFSTMFKGMINFQ